MSNYKYTERVNKLAEEMAKQNYADIITTYTDWEIWDNLSDYNKELEIASHINLAKLAVKKQSEAIRDFFFREFCNRNGCKEGRPSFVIPEFDERCGYVNQYLIDNGFEDEGIKITKQAENTIPDGFARLKWDDGVNQLDVVAPFNPNFDSKSSSDLGPIKLVDPKTGKVINKTNNENEKK